MLPQLLSALPPPAVPFSSPQTTCPPCTEALEAPVKASGQRPAQHVPHLIGPSQDPAPPGLGNKKGGGPGSTGSPWPCTQKGGRQRHFPGWQVLVSDSAQSARAEERRGWVSPGSTDMQGQECGQGPWGGKVGGSRHSGHFSKVLAVGGGQLVNSHTPPQEQSGWANPKYQSYLAQTSQ